jgi:hypothetical protein
MWVPVLWEHLAMMVAGHQKGEARIELTDIRFSK